MDTASCYSLSSSVDLTAFVAAVHYRKDRLKDSRDVKRRPRQGGEYHMNEQWPEYWRQAFANQHFDMFDPFRPLLWHDERVAFYYRQNLFLFIRHDVLTANPRFSQLLEMKDGNGLMLVQDYILFGNVGALSTLKRLPHLLWEALRRRVQRLFLKKTDLRAGNPCRKVEPH